MKKASLFIKDCSAKVREMALEYSKFTIVLQKVPSTLDSSLMATNMEMVSRLIKVVYIMKENGKTIKDMGWVN